jgi:DNA polymerase III delta prime subunit
VTGGVAAVLQLTLLPPGVIVVQGIGAFGLSVLALELSIAALLLVAQTTRLRRQSGTLLRIRLPQRLREQRMADTGADLLRALHRQIPPHGVALGNAPWLALTLTGHADEPVTLGAWIAGGSARQRDGWAATLRKTVEGLAPDAVIDVRPDPLAALTPGHIVAWATWQLALPPHFPLRLHDDRDTGDLLGPLVAALHPQPGVAQTEVQIILQPRPEDVHLAHGWRADGMRRLLRLAGKHEYALPPDAKALEAKLQGPVYAVTLRALAVADNPTAATAELGEVAAIIGQYAARSGSRLQRWTNAGGGVLRVPPRVRPWHEFLHTMASLVCGVIAGTVIVAHQAALVAHVGAYLTGRWPLLDFPSALSRTLPHTLVLLSACMIALVVISLAGHVRRSHERVRLASLQVRTPRATPLPGLLLRAAWRGPAMLGPAELAGMWHLPTASLGRLVRWLPCQVLPPPPHAFVPPDAERGQASIWSRRWRVWCRRQEAVIASTEARPPNRLVLGSGRHRDGTEAPVGLPLRDARQGLAFTAPPGVGKTQLASNLADQLRPCGYTLIDGKGDDAGNLVATMRQRIPLHDEARLVVLDVLDAAWPVGLNPLAGVDLGDPGGVDQVLGQIEAIFARLDPETWTKAPRMKNYLRKATLLVLAGESHPTIAHVKQALLDERYRQHLLSHCRNVEVRDFWTVEFPQIGEPQRMSRDALVSRFDMLLDSELTRYLFNQTTPALSFADAIAERLIVLAPLPHRALGGLAGPVGMLLFQGLMRAAFRRPGSDLTRSEYGFIGDEFQVLVEHCDTKDVRDALTQVRSFGIVTVIANQLHAQLGDLADYALTAIANRVILRTQEPDATLYARHYAESGITAADISGQEPREHQYAWFGVEGKLTRLFSMRPLPWLPSLEVEAPVYAGPSWQDALPPDSPTPMFDQTICALMYGTHDDPLAVAEALAAATDEQWTQLLARWDAIRVYQRQYILDHPGCIPDTNTRQVWLSRLRAARPRVLAQAEYARIRRAVVPSGSAHNVRVCAAASNAPPMPTFAAVPVTQQPHFTELEQREPQRLARVEPSDAPVGSRHDEPHALE